MTEVSQQAQTKGFLGWVEKTGNKLPDPVFLFAYFIIGLVVISIACAMLASYMATTGRSTLPPLDASFWWFAWAAGFAQMLANGGALDGERIVGRKTLELMHSNRMTPSMLPIEIMGQPMGGFGFGLGSRVMLDPAANDGPGSVGEFGWAGAAKTYFWVDPVEEIVGVFMSQYMTGIQTPDRTFRQVVYQALVD